MNNRESLELAARAAGIKHKGIYCNDRGLKLGGEGDEYSGWMIWWNPLKDSGDALKLAIDLNINLYEALDFYCTEDEYKKNPKECIREAIVLAAAMKGLNKK